MSARRKVEWHWADSSPNVLEGEIKTRDAWEVSRRAGEPVYDLIDIDGTLVAIYTVGDWQDLEEVAPYFVDCTRPRTPNPGASK